MSKRMYRWMERPSYEESRRVSNYAGKFELTKFELSYADDSIEFMSWLNDIAARGWRLVIIKDDKVLFEKEE